MPFTLAHPAAVLPIKRFWPGANLPALVIGSMTPDFAYFYRLGVPGAFSHSAEGIFLFCVPIGLVAYVLYFLVLRGPVLELLPAFLRHRMERQFTAWVPRGLGGLAGLLGSLAIGAMTHLLWDSFTHGNTAAVRHFPSLAQQLGPFNSIRLPLYNLLQHASTLAGLAILAVCAGRRLRAMPVLPSRLQDAPPPAFYLRASAIVFLVLAALLGLFSGLGDAAGMPLERTLFFGIVRSFRYLTSAVLLYAVTAQGLVLWRERSLLT
jgi:hypothetical protein